MITTLNWLTDCGAATPDNLIALVLPPDKTIIRIPGVPSGEAVFTSRGDGTIHVQQTAQPLWPTLILDNRTSVLAMLSLIHQGDADHNPNPIQWANEQLRKLGIVQFPWKSFGSKRHVYLLDWNGDRIKLSYSIKSNLWVAHTIQGMTLKPFRATGLAEAQTDNVTTLRTFIEDVLLDPLWRPLTTENLDPVLIRGSAAPGCPGQPLRPPLVFSKTPPLRDASDTV